MSHVYKTIGSLVVKGGGSLTLELKALFSIELNFLAKDCDLPVSVA